MRTIFCNDYKVEITAIHDIRWLGELMGKTTYHCDVYFSSVPKNPEIRFGFVLRRKFRNFVIPWIPINGRLCWIRLRGSSKFFLLASIGKHSPNDGTNDYDMNLIEFAELRNIKPSYSTSASRKKHGVDQMELQETKLTIFYATEGTP